MQRLKVLLNEEGRFPLQQSGNTFVKGWGYDDSGKPVNAAFIAGKVADLSKREDVVQFVKELNGFFVIVTDTEEGDVVFVDRCCSLPIVFFYQGETVCVTDDIARIPDNKNSESALFRIEFKGAGFVAGKNTLSGGIWQLKAGEYLWVSDRDYSVYTYHTFTKASLKQGNTSEDAFLQQFEQTAERAFDRVIGSLGNNVVWVPLTAGFDSRFILAMLKQGGVQNIRTYTYGKQESYEKEIASLTSETLGVPWYDITYDQSVFETFFSEEYAQYEVQTHLLRALPYEQDYFAVNELIRSGEMQEDDVVFSGFGGDVLAGSWVPSDYYREKNKKGSDALAKYILENPKFFDYQCVGNDKKNITSHINEEVSEYLNTHPGEFINGFIEWGIQNRLCKYQLSGLRSFEFFNLNWRLPFFDREYIDFWSSVPHHLKKDKQLYKNFIRERLFKPMGIDFEHKSAQHLREKWPYRYIRNFLPDVFRNLLKKIFLGSKEVDVNNFDILKGMLVNKMNKNISKEKESLVALEAEYFFERQGQGR